MSTKDKCGIYCIRCRITGKMYVGSSRNIYNRWTRHRSLLRRGNNGCWRLQLAWTRHGEAAFEFSVLEECSAEALLEREQFHIDSLKPELNVVTDLDPGVVALAIKANRKRWAKITHCPHGHDFSVENTYIDRNGTRICRTCNRERVARVISAETPEQRAKRIRRNNENYHANRSRNRAKQTEYAAARRMEKRSYDQANREKANERRRSRRPSSQPEESSV